MEINISQTEHYRIELPEKPNWQEFVMLVDRLNRIEKLLGKDTMVGLQPNLVREQPKAKRMNGASRSKNKEIRTKLYENRELVIQLYKVFYSKDRQAWEKLLTDNQLESYLSGRNIMSSGGMLAIKKSHNIKADEVGLVKFPDRGELTLQYKK